MARKDEIVIGIDFGTTYSGVSWALNAGNKIVRVIDDWPNPIGGNSYNAKVPSIITYKDEKPHQWGYEVSLTASCLKWFKLLLDPEHKFRQMALPLVASRNTLGKVERTAEDATSDYLRFLWNYTKADIAKFRGTNWEDLHDVSVVLTIPGIWSPKAQDATLRTANAAGLPGRLQIVSEPEAAAIAVLKDKTENDAGLQIGDAFVVCDAGGGTVDLISYCIRALNPMRLEECASGDGGLCGSVFLDHTFEKYIRLLVGEKEYSRIKEVKRKRMLRDFDQGVKRAFDGTDKVYTVELDGVEEDLDNDIYEDVIKLKPNALRTVFDHVINQILTLVESQIDEAVERGHHVKAVLLVGGFGSNRYLYKRLQESRRNDGIAILQDTNASSAVCRGATLWGLDLEVRMKDKSRTERNDGWQEVALLKKTLEEMKQDMATQQLLLKDTLHQLEQEQEKCEKIKISAGRMQSLLENDVLQRGELAGQLTDTAICTQFRMLFDRIKQWSSNIGSRVDQGQPSKCFQDSNLSAYNRVVPCCTTIQDLEGFLATSKKRRRRFTRAWVSYVMTRSLVRVVPSWEKPVYDHWAENHVSSVFARLEDSFHAAHENIDADINVASTESSSVSSIAISSFHEWRAVSALLLSNLYPDATEFAQPYISQAIGEVMRVIRPWIEPQLLDVLLRDLHEILLAAINFSRTLRMQRASWSLRFPGAPIAANGPSKLMYDPDTMVDEFGNHEDFSGDQLRQKTVDFVVEPALFKRGNLDRQKFDVEFAVMPAMVVMHDDVEA